MLHVTLKVVGGETESSEIPLSLPAIIGRSRNADVNLSHPLVSRRHCELCEVNGQLRVRDLGSLNGTFIGSERIIEAVLRPGELLTVGTVTFRAVYDSGDPRGPTGPTGTERMDRSETARPAKETLRVDAPPDQPNDTKLGPHIDPRATMPHQTPPR